LAAVAKTIAIRSRRRWPPGRRPRMGARGCLASAARDLMRAARATAVVARGVDTTRLKGGIRWSGGGTGGIDDVGAPSRRSPPSSSSTPRPSRGVCRCRGSDGPGGGARGDEGQGPVFGGRERTERLEDDRRPRGPECAVQRLCRAAVAPTGEFNGRLCASGGSPRQGIGSDVGGRLPRPTLAVSAGGHVRGQAGHVSASREAGRNGGRTADNPIYGQCPSARERGSL
jgi:hypothetical protein